MPLFYINIKLIMGENKLTLAMAEKGHTLDPNRITGFTDAEGSFIISIYINKVQDKTKWRVQASFQIELHIRDLYLLLQIKSFFFNNTGNIYIKNNKSAIYSIRTLNSIKGNIIPHFKKYPLITQKYTDFILFKDIVKLINNNEHLNKEGLKKIISFKASLNRLSKGLNTYFPDIKKANRIKVNIPTIINCYGIAGFISGDGCFYVNITKSKYCKIGYSIKLRISITQHYKDELLMNKIANALKCGNVYKHSKDGVVFMVSIFEDIYSIIIIPLLNKYQIRGIKYLDFKDFCTVGKLINQEIHLTLKGLKEIRKIKFGMNRGRLGLEVVY